MHENVEMGADVGSFGCKNFGPYTGVAVPNPCVRPRRTILSNLNNLDAKNL